MELIATYIVVAWLTSCSPQGWVDQFRGSMNLEEAKASLSVRQCIPIPPLTGFRDGRGICVENPGVKIGYAAIRREGTGPRVEMGPNVRECLAPSS